MNGRLALASFLCHLDETVASLDARLTDRLSLPAAHRILARGKELRATSNETLRDVGVVASDTLYVIASDDAAVRAMRAAVEDPLVRGFSRPPPRFTAPPPRTGGGVRAIGSAGASRYGFESVRPLPGYADSARAEALLQELAEDPGFKRVMEEHRWVVGCLAEMEPDGKVGVDPVCVLGYNTNKGAEIHLRLRTDDKKGFRPVYKLKEVLAHELAHNVHSEHDNQFYELMRQVELEARQFDWRQSAGHTVANASSGTRGKLPKIAPSALDPLDTAGTSAGPSLNFARRLGTVSNSKSSLASMSPSRNESVMATTEIPCGLPNYRQPFLEDGKPKVEIGSRPATGGDRLSGPDAADVPSPNKLRQKSSSSEASNSNIVAADGERAGNEKQRPCGAHTFVTDPTDASDGLRKLDAEANRPAGLDILTAMGFPLGLAKIALRESDDDPGRAADWLAALQTEDGRSESLAASLGPLGPTSNFASDQELSERLQHAIDCLQTEVDDNSAFVSALTTLHAYVYNILKHPGTERYSSVNNANASFWERIGRYEAGQMMMRTIGFNLDGGRWTLSGSVDLARVWMSKAIIVKCLVKAEPA
jgi:hypothetical protein